MKNRLAIFVFLILLISIFSAYADAPKIIYGDVPSQISLNKENLFSFWYLDTSGKIIPVSGAQTVIYKWGSNDILISGITNNEGKFNFNPDYIGKFRLEVSAEGLYRYTKEFNSAEIKKSNIQLPSIQWTAILGNSILIILTLFTIVVLIITVKRYSELIKRKKKKESMSNLVSALVTFIEKAIEKGYSKTKIKKLLLEKKWPKKTVEEYVDYVWKEHKFN